MAAALQPRDWVLGDEIARGAFSALHRVTVAGVPYALKLYRPAVDPEDAAKLVRLARTEAHVLARLDHPALVKVFDSGILDGRAYVLLELIDGLDLAATLRARRAPFEAATVGRWGAALAGALAVIHEAGYVHRDVKPANVLVTRDGDVKLVDLGLVEGVQRADGFAGSAFYASPEQLQLTNRPVDHRSDLYSLGLVLFEAATGARPFAATTASEHIRLVAKGDVPLATELLPGVGPGFARIVAKLLVNDPDRRYGSAEALAKDLVRLREIERAVAAGTDVVLGQGAGDAGSGTRAVALVGRESETERIMAALTAPTGPGLVTLEGDPGAGKTALATAVVTLAAKRGAEVLRLRALDGDPRPLGPLRDALTEQLRLAERRGARAAFVRKIETAAGNAAGHGAGIVATLFPVLGLKSPAKELTETAEEVHAALGRFLAAFLGDETESLLLVDDAQWLDAATTSVLLAAAPRLDRARTRILATVRGPQSAPGAADAFAARLALLSPLRIALRPLGDDAADFFVRGFLGHSEVDPTLAPEIGRRSGGNPFAMAELLRALLAEGVLKFSWGAWSVDRQGLTALHLPDNLLGLVLRRFGELSGAAQAALGRAAVCGRRFDAAVVARSLGQTEDVTRRLLNEATLAQLVLQLDDGSLCFAHDRVREAALSALEEVERRAAHQAVGVALQLVQGDGADVYEVAEHFLQGLHALAPDRTFAACMTAGHRALADFAAGNARRFLGQAEELAHRCGWTVAFDHSLALSHACFRMHDVSAAGPYARAAVKSAATAEQRIRARIQLTCVLIFELDIPAAREEFRLGLAELGRPLPKSRAGAVVWVARALAGGAVAWTAGRFGWRPDVAQRRADDQLGRLFWYGAILANYDFDNGLLVLCATGIMGPALRQGPGPAYLDMLYLVLVVISLLELKPLARRVRAKVDELLPVHATSEQRAQLLLMLAIVEEFRGNSVQACAAYASAYAEQGDILDTTVASAARILHYSNLAIRGHVDDAWPILEALGRLYEKYGSPGDPSPIHAAMRHLQACYLTTMGRLSEATHELARAHDAARHIVAKGRSLSRAYWALVLGARVSIAFDTDDWAQLEEVETQFWQVFPDNRWTMAYGLRLPVTLFFLARLREWYAATPAKRPGIAARLRRSARATVAGHPYPMLRGFAALARAFAALAAGRYETALRRLVAVEREAAQQESPRLLAESQVMRAMVYQAWGRTAETARMAEVAERTAAAGGLNRHARFIRRLFDLEGAAPSLAGDGGSRSLAASSQSSGHRQLVEHAALLQVGLAAASILDPIDMARTAMRELMGILGAERAFLFLREDEEDVSRLVVALGVDGPMDAGVDGRDAPKDYSRGLVSRVELAGEAVIWSGSEAEDGGKSLVLHDLRSAMAAPLKAQGKVTGVLYLDSRLARGIFTPADLDLLSALVVHIEAKIEAARLARTELDRSELRREAELAGAVQELLVPPPGLVEAGSLRLASHFQPAARMGGDWWTWHRLPDGGLAVILGDVTGHGLGPAMITAAVAGAWHAFKHDPARLAAADWAPDFLRSLDATLLDLAKGTYLMACLVVEVPADRTVVRLHGAGAPPVALLRAGQRKEEVVFVGGSLAGTGEGDIGKAEAPLAPGDSLVAYTDGCYELQSPAGHTFGHSTFQRLLRRLGGRPADECVEAVVRELEAYRGNKALQDDLTLLVVERKRPV